MQLVLLPGLDGTGDLFRRFCNSIPREHDVQVVAYPTDGVLSYDELLVWIELQIEATAGLVVIGESFSGPLAIRFAAAHPERVRALVLCATFVTNPLPRGLGWVTALAHAWALRSRIPAWVARHFLVGRDADGALVAELQTATGKVERRVLAGRIRCFRRLDVRAELRAVTAPILSLRGRRDRIVGVRSSHSILRERPGCSAVALDAPHLVLQTRPAEAWEAIEQFLASIVTR